MAVFIWQPSEACVVLGRSNIAEQEAYLDRCEQDNIAVLKRYGGGGTVLLHEGCLIVSVGAWVDSPYHNDRYFRLLNDAVTTTIQRLLPLPFAQRGFSDIVQDDRKIAGTSLFRSRNYLLYQASILVDTNIEAIEKYLRHPSKEPEYRRARGHRDFLSSLKILQELNGHIRPLQTADWLAHFLDFFETDLKACLGEHLIDPLEAHIPHLLKRAGL